jgi:protein-S-isoprenylcysteine O-methyltransferase Ste14
MTEILIFIAMSIAILLVSKNSLKSPKSHGYYRFFAWECIAAQFALNFKFWVFNPFSWYQIISWGLLCVSIIPLAFGVRSLISQGKPAEKRIGNEELLAFEKTTTLVTTGIYQWIRHPLYSSLLFLSWGIFFKAPSLVGILLAAAATFFLIATARADEAECALFFGKSYQDYRTHTKKFIPFIY